MRILAIKLSSLGDLFHALPAVHALKMGLGAEIDWVVQSEYADVVRCFPDVARVVEFDRRHPMRGLPSLVAAVRRDVYDLVVDFQGLFKSAWITGLARGGRRIGPSFHREFSQFFYTDIAGRRDKNRHAVDENLDVVRFLGMEAGKAEFPTRFPEPAFDDPGPRVALLPVSRWATKNWPSRCFAEVGRRLRGAGVGSVYVLGGRGEAPVCADVASAIGPGARNLAGTLSLPELGGVLKQMDLVIANDTGPIHMAAAVGTRTLVVFGPTDPGRTGPYGQGHRVVQAKLDCQPCFSRTCRRGGVPCLSGVTPERVSETALEMLK